MPIAPSYPSTPPFNIAKRCTLKLVQEATSKGEINDTNLYLQPFCKNVEQVFQKGLVCNYSALGFTKSAESWHWMKQLDLRDGSSSSYEASVKMVGSCNKAVSPRGKLRLLIRTCLVNKCLHVPVQILVRKKHPRGVYDPVRSILGDEILGEIFLSVLLQCSRLVFRLNLNNSVFLDECWELPDCLALELVPSKALGICVTFVGGKALVAGIKRTSVAAEDGKVCVGDILEELNGNHVTTSSHGKLGAIMRKGSGKPITATHDLLIPKARKGLYQPRTEVKQTFYTRHTRRHTDEEHCSEVKRADISHTRHTTRHTDEEHPTEVKREDVSHMEHWRRINQAHHSKTGDLYPPIINLLHQARLDPDDVRAKQLAALHGDVCLDDALIMNGHEVTYLNCVSTGTHGDVRVIEQGMNLVLQGHTQKINSKVLFECQEMAVNVTDVATNKVLLKHSYMEISSCGKSVSWPLYFAYVAGDQSCNISKSFTCYVFFCSNEDHTNNILQSIAVTLAKPSVEGLKLSKGAQRNPRKVESLFLTCPWPWPISGLIWGLQESNILPSKSLQESKSLPSKGRQESKSLPSKGVKRTIAYRPRAFKRARAYRLRAFKRARVYRPRAFKGSRAYHPRTFKRARAYRQEQDSD
uniref:PDZ domain-containing protein n=1 Tax=Timema genevievae TaxID=629358 RepID=A0A7R9K609_TIMGE|nr:unnamed protein product [Timema genevievae]